MGDLAHGCPGVRYAMSGDVSIAYQVVGTGPVDLVLVAARVSNVELAWDDPHSVTFYRALAEFSRLIVFDKRGTGLSDRVTGVAPLEVRVDDLRAVMDAAGSERAAVIGFSEGVPWQRCLEPPIRRESRRSSSVSEPPDTRGASEAACGHRQGADGHAPRGASRFTRSQPRPPTPPRAPISCPTVFVCGGSRARPQLRRRGTRPGRSAAA